MWIFPVWRKSNLGGNFVFVIQVLNPRAKFSEHNPELQWESNVSAVLFPSSACWLLWLVWNVCGGGEQRCVHTFVCRRQSCSSSVTPSGTGYWKSNAQIINGELISPQAFVTDPKADPSQSRSRTLKSQLASSRYWQISKKNSFSMMRIQNQHRKDECMCVCAFPFQGCVVNVRKPSGSTQLSHQCVFKIKLS